MVRPKSLVTALTVLALLLVAAHGDTAVLTPRPTLAKLDIKDAAIQSSRAQPRGTLRVAQHFTLSPTWLDPQEQQPAIIQQAFSYLIHDALIKPMPQGYFTYSLAESLEMPSDYTYAKFRLRDGLKFQNGAPLMTEDVKWSYEHYQGVHAATFRDKTDRIEILDDRTIIFHFKGPFLEFLELYNGIPSGSGWILPKAYYEEVGAEGFKQHPIGAGPFKFVSQKAGVQVVAEAWDGYWRRTPGVQQIVITHVREFTSRLAALKTGEADLAYGLTGDILRQVMQDPKLRWDRNFTNPWYLLFPGYREPDSPFHDKRVRQAISLTINRQFLTQVESEGIGPVWCSWIGADRLHALACPDDFPLPGYDREKARQLLAAAGYAQGLQLDAYAPFPPYFKMAERVVTDLGAIGIKIKVQAMEQPAFRAKMAEGRHGWPGNRTIIHDISVQPGSAASTIRLQATCESSSSMICEPYIETRWATYEASIDPEERSRLLKEIQKYVIQEYLIVPLYINPFVHVVGPRVLPEGDAPPGEGFHRYWATPQAPFPWPWEEWEVRE
ncbi:MAG: ABC transporter substrate-binding protein [Candidatus Entotheonellia bacterium]